MRSVNARPFRLLGGLIVGLVAGVTTSGTSQGALEQVLQPIGSLWLDALTMTVVPLVFGLLVVGVATAPRDVVAEGITARALVLFALMLTAASITAAFLAEAFLRYWPAVQDTLQPSDAAPVIPSIGEWYKSIIPENPIKAAAETAMVPLVVFSLFFGFALARIAKGSADALLNPLRALVDVMLVIVGWVLAVAPLGIAALAFGAGARLGWSILGALGQYIVVVALCCGAATLLAYGWAAVIGRVAPLRFARAALAPQAVALGTQSSLACLPIMIDATRALDVPEEAANIALPMAVSLFRAASVAANVAVTVYLAHVHAVPMGTGVLMLAALVAVPVSLGAVGLPAQVSFFATIAPVCIAVGVPVAALPLLLAIETVPDLFRTLGNVTNDLAVACAIGSGAPLRKANLD